MRQLAAEGLLSNRAGTVERARRIAWELERALARSRGGALPADVEALAAELVAAVKAL